MAAAYFFYGNSLDNQYRSSRAGEPENDAFLTKATENYQKAAEKLSASADPNDKALGKLALQYLVAAYGADKLNDPASAEPVVQRMIQLDPSDVDNYFALANIYEIEAKRFLEYSLRWRNVPKPSIAAVQGVCIAGGLLLAWPCDLIIAADNATFSDPVVAMMTI